jgi:hypothetical protein
MLHNRSLVEAASAVLDVTTRTFFERAFEAWYRLPPDADCYNVYYGYVQSRSYDPVLPMWVTQFARQTILETV